MKHYYCPQVWRRMDVGRQNAVSFDYRYVDLVPSAFANVGAGLLKSVDNEFRTVHLCRVAVVEIIVEQHPLSYKVAVPFVQP